MVCMARAPTFVFANCGHLGVCGHCGKWMLTKQYNNAKSKDNQLPFAELAWKKIEEVKVSCPICRETTRILHRTKHSGIFFAV